MGDGRDSNFCLGTIVADEMDCFLVEIGPTIW